LVFNFGGAPELTPSASCSVQPNEVLVGEPITATVTTSNFNPKHTLTYDWTTNGGKVSGKDTTANLDTNGVAGGKLCRYRSRGRFQDEEGRGSKLYRQLHREGAAEESADNVLLRESSLGSGGHTFHDNLYLHQPGQRAGHGQQLDRERRQHFRRRQHRYSEHHGSLGRSHYRKRHLYRFSRPHRPGFVAGDSGSSAATSAGGQQAERVRIPQQGQTLARG
jgi:hypothetical protein